MRLAKQSPKATFLRNVDHRLAGSSQERDERLIYLIAVYLWNDSSERYFIGKERERETERKGKKKTVVSKYRIVQSKKNKLTELPVAMLLGSALFGTWLWHTRLC